MTVIAIRELWQCHVAGTASGLVGVTVMPPETPGQWLKAPARGYFGPSLMR